MAKEYVKKWKVPSSSNPDKAYTVSLTKEGAYECSCPTWIYRRQECHHVRTIKANPDLPAARIQVGTRDLLDLPIERVHLFRAPCTMPLRYGLPHAMHG